MLFTKKVKFNISEKQIREELTAPDGNIVLRINLRYPDIICPKKDPLNINAVSFYKRLAEGFGTYARTELYKSALAEYKRAPEGFNAFSAVMRWEKTLENEKYISLFLDISVFNGGNIPFTERKTQVWDRTLGTKCRCSDFLPKKSFSFFESYVGAENRKAFDRESFVLREDGYEFFFRAKGEYKSVVIPREEIAV